MLMNGQRTIKQGAERWVGEFNAIPQQFLINALQDRIYDELVEVLPDLVVCKSCESEFESEDHENWVEHCESQDWDVTCRKCGKLDGEFVDYHEYQVEVKGIDHLPMWGTMWHFQTSLDDDWVLENIDTVYKCGFRVYENEDLGVVIGIDGAGYDFYEAHWIPLYKARGLQWHDVE